MLQSTHIPQGAVASVPIDGVKRALILPGGGLRLSYAAGVMDVLLNRNLTFSIMDATSGGALNLAMLLSGLTTTEMCDRWRSLKMRTTFSFMPLRNYLWPSCFVAASASKSFRRKVYPHLGINFEKIRAATGVQASFNVCNFANKANEVIPHTDLTEDFLIAGMSLPATMPPVTIDGRQYLDSGFIQDANLIEAIKRGANELWLIWVMGNIPTYRSGPLNAYVQMLEMSANGALVKELSYIEEINQRIKNGERPYGHEHPIVLHLIKPEHPLPLDSALYTGAITHSELISQGRTDANNYLNSMHPSGVPFNLEILKMITKKAGLQFKETMKGGFSLGVSDPTTGLKQGRSNGTHLAMHAKVDIASMSDFITDPEHTGKLTGSIDFAPLGIGIPAHSGVFNLFKPTSDPKLTLMVYELAFEHQGQQYYLAGRKEVRQGSIFRLWSETTTLYTQLHQGSDKSGPIIGSGTLSLGVIDLLKLLSTVTITNSNGFFDKVKTITKFTCFFSKQLWKTYVIHKTK